jgi:8-oxo-dGTP pyrophosphatase MutT (NUDIX family)
VIREFSAGGLVVRNMRGRPHLAVVRVRDAILALPKGHPEKDESSQEAALREVREETGLDDVEDHDHEVEEALWIPLEEAPERLAYKSEKAIAKTALVRLAQES